MSTRSCLSREDLLEVLRKAQVEVEDYILLNNLGGDHPLQGIWLSIEKLKL